MGQKARRSSRCKPCIASGTTKCLASAGLFFCFGCGRFFSPSWEDSSSGKRQRLDSSAAFFYLQAGPARSRTTKNRREGRFLCCPGPPWKRLGSQDGASGETRTLTLSPETDFESAASTDSATEAMAAQYREAPTVGQSGSWRGKHISGKLRGLSRVSPCVSPIFISTCPRP